LWIPFKRGSNTAAFRGEGWSYEEPNQIWTVGRRSSLRFPIAASGQTVILDLHVAPFISPPLLRAQLLRIFVGERLYQTTILTERCVLRLRIPPELLSGHGLLELRFEHPGYLSPSAMRRSNDKRPLAIAFFSVRLFVSADEEAKANLAWLSAKARVHELERLPAGQTTDAQTGCDAPQHFTIPAFYGRGKLSPAQNFLKEGWALGQDKALGSTWTNAPVSRILAPGSTKTGPHLLWLHIGALTGKELPFQEFMVFLDGVALGQFRCESNDTVMAIPVPAELVANKSEIVVEFDLPSASRPCEIGRGSDSRLLALRLTHLDIVEPPARLSWLARIRHDEASPVAPVAKSARFQDGGLDTLPAVIEGELGISLNALMRRFESLGENCEFGVVARKLGLELLHMFRFGSVKLSGLLRGLSEEFAELDRGSGYSLEAASGERAEYHFVIESYFLRWHTYMYKHTHDQKEVLNTQGTKYLYLRRKFLEGLGTSKKIYVVKRDPPLSFAEASALLLSLNRYGRNTLLYVAPSETQPSGTVEVIGPGLMRGHIASFAAREDVGNTTDPTDWLKLMANAWLLDRDFSAPFRAETA
jgi:hypothetical protein